MNTAPVDGKTLLGLVLRTVIAGAAGGLVSRGDITQADIESLSGIGVLLLVGGWSWFQKKRAAKRLAQAQTGGF